MRYIRLKDGRVLDTLDERGTAISQTRKQCDFEDFVVVQNRLGDFAIPKTEIVKQANTIKKLCDELIIKNPNVNEKFYSIVFVYQGAWKNILNKKHAKFCTSRDIYEHDVEIFGAIWVIDSNGVPTLKPVSKMNEKGELELL